MLQNLHVKNLALIDEAEVDFSGGLNILTGETGAGKSIILGSVSLALGGRYSADMLRKGADKGLVELTFYVENPETVRKLEKMDLSPPQCHSLSIDPAHTSVSVKPSGDNDLPSVRRKIHLFQLPYRFRIFHIKGQFYKSLIGSLTKHIC